MLITLESGCDASVVRDRVEALGLWTRPMKAANGQSGLAVLPYSKVVDWAEVEQLPGVACVWKQAPSHPLVSAVAGQSVTAGGLEIGGTADAVLIAGPCAANTEDQVLRAAESAAEAGAKMLRGGAFKPRTSPHSFQGRGYEALRWLRDAADAFSMALVTEAMSETHVSEVAEVADFVQVGSRNIQCFPLLKAVGRTGSAVLLKRGMAATIEEWLLAGEYLLASGASGVVFCERGVRGFDSSTRNLLDLGAVSLLAHVHRVPVIVDPSHAVGRRDLILPLGRAAIAAGAHGLMVESDDPALAITDTPQALGRTELAELGRSF